MGEHRREPKHLNPMSAAGRDSKNPFHRPFGFSRVQRFGKTGSTHRTSPQAGIVPDGTTAALSIRSDGTCDAEIGI
jgi:hypothetical protein